MLTAIWTMFNFVMSIVLTAKSKHGHYWHTLRCTVAFIDIIVQQHIVLFPPSRANVFDMTTFQWRMISMERVFGQIGIRK